MRFHFYLLALLALFVAAQPVVAQPECAAGRYYDDLFGIDVQLGIRYGENLQPNLLNPNATQTLRFDLYTPQGDIVTNRPLIIWAFGGGFVSGLRTSPDIVDLSRRFAARGYVCVSIDYRLTPEMAINGDQPTAYKAVMKAVHDMRAAVRFFYKSVAEDGNPYGIDTNRIWVGGVSAGGFTALHTAYLDEVSEVPAVLLPDYAALGGLEGLSGNPGFSSRVAGVINLCGAIGDTAWIKPGDLPVVSVHGTEDAVVPYGADTLGLFGINLPLYGSEPIHQHAAALGNTHRFYSFAGAGHTPFILGTQTAQYMDTTFNVVRQFLYEHICPDLAGSTQRGAIAAVPEFDMWPNPTQVTLQLALPSNADLTNMRLQVRNMLGQVVLEQPINEVITSVSVATIPAGVYTLELQSLAGESRGFRRFVKQ